MNQQVMAGRVGNDPGAERCSQAGILQDHVECVVDLRGLALAQRRGIDALRFAEEDECAIDEVRAEIPKDTRGGKVCHLAPGARLGIQAETIEARFVLSNVAEGAR